MAYVLPKTLSVVVNTCNRAASLENTIRSLLQQSDCAMEVIVVNGPSVDDSSEIIRRYAGKIKSAKCDVLNLAVSRNIGIAASAGDVVAFIDDDAIPEPHWATRLLGAYTEDDIGGAGGFVFDHTGVSFQATYITCDRYGSSWTNEPFDPSDKWSFPGAFKYGALIGTNCSFRKHVLLEIGGFDEEFEYFLDETDVCVRVIDAGYRLVQLRDAFVHHRFLPSNVRNSKRAVKYHYPIFKNSLYFALKHAKKRIGLAAVQLHSENVYQAHLRDATWLVDKGDISRDILDRLRVTHERATRDAMERSEYFDRKYLRESTLAEFRKYSREFLNIPAHRIEKRLSIALLCRTFDSVDSGIARFVREQAQALAAFGHTVHILTLTSKDPTVDWEDGVWIHRVSAGMYDDQPSSLDTPIHPSQWCYSRAMLDEVRRIHERHQIDVVDAPLWDNEAIAFATARQFPLVVSLQTSTGIALESHPEWSKNTEHMREFVSPAIQAENYVMRNCDAIRAISGAIASEISKRNKISFAGLPVEVCYLGFRDRSAGVPATGAMESREETTVFFLGRLELRKGIDTLLNAVPDVLGMFPNAKFVLAGDDSLKIPGESRTFRQVFEERYPAECRHVSFLGRISDQTAEWHFRNATVFVAPSRFESFGIIYVEAMMFSVPIVACKVGGVPEVVKDGEDGILVEANDPKSLAQAICKLLADANLRRDMGMHGRASFLERFNADCATDRLAAMYGRAIAKGVS